MPVIEQGADGERIFFSSTGRTLADEDQICVLSVGVDIGSSTSHLVFSRIVLERLDSRYVVTERETFYQSDILLTPYASADEIDADALGAFIGKQYESAGGQVVFHLHVHVIPRHAGVALKAPASVKEAPDVLAAHAERLKAALGS